MISIETILILCKSTSRLDFVSCENSSSQIYKLKLLNSNPGANISLYGLVKISHLDHIAITFNTENSISTIRSKKENKCYDIASKNATTVNIMAFGRIPELIKMQLL